MKTNKKDLIKAVAEKTGFSNKDAEKAINAVIDSIIGGLKTKDDKVQLVGFGTFEIKERSGRKGRNPRTGAEMDIPASKLPVFRAGQAFKDAVK